MKKVIKILEHYHYSRTFIALQADQLQYSLTPDVH